MPDKSHATTAALFHRRNHSMDDATKAGIGATVCSVLILAIVFISMHTLPISIGYADHSTRGFELPPAFATPAVPQVLDLPD